LLALLGYFKSILQAWKDYPKAEGTVLEGRYTIIRFLGIGSYGLTYVCRDVQSGDLVVLKQSKPSKGKLSRELLEKEIQIQSRLRHSQIPRCLHAFRCRKQLYMVTDYIEGQTVEDLIFEKGEAFTEEESLRFISELLKLVRFLHDHGIVHLDIRIPNVMVRDGQIYLIDFGLSRQMGESIDDKVLVDGKLLDSEELEEMRLRRTPEAASDWYALGHFLLFMLYSAYQEVPGQSAADWQEELSLSVHTTRLLRKLLQLDPPYESSEQLMQDLQAAKG
jgi:serine/threonine-protein kinase